MTHLPLIIFTICMQASIGLILFTLIARLLNKEVNCKQASIVSAGLAVVGVLASVFHLGNPLGAYNALREFGSSWLSREIWFSSIFLALVVVTMILVWFKPSNKNFITGIMVVATIIGFIDVYVMGAIYYYTSIPAWGTLGTFVEFYAATISMGALLAFVLTKTGDSKMNKIVGVAVFASIVVQVAFVIPSYITMGVSDSMAMLSSLAILNRLAVVMGLKWIFIFVAAALSLILIFKNLDKKVYNMLIVASVLMVCGQLVGRYLFYSTEVVTRIGLF